MVAVHLPLPGLVRQPPDTMVGLTSPAHMFRKFGWEIRQLIPGPIDQNRCAHWRNPMDMIRQG
jgi:hypothetical protein